MWVSSVYGYKVFFSIFNTKEPVLQKEYESFMSKKFGKQLKTKFEKFQIVLENG